MYSITVDGITNPHNTQTPTFRSDPVFSGSRVTNIMLILTSQMCCRLYEFPLALTRSVPALSIKIMSTNLINHLYYNLLNIYGRNNIYQYLTCQNTYLNLWESREVHEVVQMGGDVGGDGVD